VSRGLLLADGETSRVACARGQLRRGVDEQTGEVLTAAMLARRVGWAAGLVAGMAAALMAAHFNSADVAALASGRDGGGRRLPAAAWMALRRLGWTAAAPEGITVSDRIVRMAQEQAGRCLRSAPWRASLTAGVVATWPADPGRRTGGEWDAVRNAVPGGGNLPSSVIRGRTRQVAAFAREHGRLPAGVFELEGPPRTTRMLLLAACDRQQATIERHKTEPRQALLRLQLPVCAAPASYRDWTWVACPVWLPPTIPPDAVLHLPALLLRDGRVRADLAWTHAVPTTTPTGHVVALGVDWGLNTLLSAGAARLGDGGRITALGAGAMFRSAGVLAKQHRLRRQGEKLHARLDRCQVLAGGRTRRGLPRSDALEASAASLRDEIRKVSARRSHLNDALAWAAARWAVDQAIAAGATVIYVEDLRSMEARGMGRTTNTRLSQAVRGQIADRTRHIAAESGIAVVTVPARGTSKHCPQCLTPLRHCKAPDRPGTPGWKWAICPACGYQGDRDMGAWKRIAARGLAHQAQTSRDRTSKIMAVRTITDKLEATAIVTAPQTSRKDRPKTGPTRRRSARPAPRRRQAPSPARPSGQAGQRPEGHAHTDRAPLPRAADRYQGANAITAPGSGHRPRGAALGAGFHLHAHASPPRWERTPAPGATPGTGSLR
jgi:hypothetical protein